MKFLEISCEIVVGPLGGGGKKRLTEILRCLPCRLVFTNIVPLTFAPESHFA